MTAALTSSSYDVETFQFSVGQRTVLVLVIRSSFHANGPATDVRAIMANIKLTTENYQTAIISVSRIAIVGILHDYSR